MEELYDIHCHILPDVDDGSPSMDATIAMLDCAIEDGITAMIATPHYHLGRKVKSYDQIEKVYRELVEEIKKHDMPIELFLGNEVFYGETAVEDIEKKEVHTMNHTRYVLIEFHPSTAFREIRQGIYSVIEKGYIPIIAHVERYHAVVDDYHLVEELIDMGCYIQVNASDVMGADGFRIKMFCKKILKERLVHFVATDAHRPDGRRVPELAKCAAYIEKKFGSDYARTIFSDNPKCVLQNKYI